MSEDNDNNEIEYSYTYEPLTLEKMIDINPYSILQKIQDKEGSITKQLIIKAITKDGIIYSYLPINFKNDKEIIFHAVNQNGLVLEYVDKNLQEFVHIHFAVKQNGLALKFANQELCNEEIYNIAINQNGLALQYIPENQHTEQIIMKAIDNNYKAIMFVAFITKNIVFQAIQKSINALDLIPELYHTEYELHDLYKGINNYLEMNPYNIKNFPNPTIEMYKNVIDKKKLINNLPYFFQTKELSIYAVSIHCVNLNYVKDEFKENCKTYLKNNENCKTHSNGLEDDYCKKNSEN
jgi:hypothetical protein